MLEPSDDPPRFSNGRVDPYGGRLLPVCCPDTPSLTLGPQLIRRLALSELPELKAHRPAVPIGR
jgi:hypothetical protein